MFRCLALAAVGLAVARAEDHWAVLIAGSSGYWNYRHQADVCHAYQVLMERGFDADKIITMIYDDVAHNKENPFPGKLYNYPWESMDDAVDVYAGCKIDYKGKQVTPKKFLAVLTGDTKTARGKVLKSKPDDHVFVNFVDHGGVGIIAFPEGDVLHATELVDALEAMHRKRMYKQLTFYLETCESGSMFEGLLPKHLPVYAVTAANAHESSWGTYCGGDAKVGNTSVGSCLGDLFSVNWMMDSDANVGIQETLGEQFTRVKNLTSKSHVMRYGQVAKFSGEDISSFEGPGSKLLGATAPAPNTAVASLHTSHVDSRDVKLDHLYHAYLRQGTAEAGERLVEEIKAREAVKALGQSLGESMPAGTGLLGAAEPGDFSWTPEMADCHARAVAEFGAACGWSEQRLPLASKLYDLCTRTAGNIEPVVAALGKACKRATPDIWA